MTLGLNSGFKSHGSDSYGRQEEIRSVLVEQLYSKAYGGFIGALAGALIITFSMWSVVPWNNLLLWSITYIVINAARQILVRQYFKPEARKISAAVWEKRFIVGNFLAGAAWGLAPIIIFPSHSIEHRYLMALLIVGISCGSAAFYWPSLPACVPTIMVELIPLAGRFFYDIGNETDGVTGAILLMFCIVLWIMARNLNTFAKESLLLGLEKDDLLESLRRARDDLEKRVEERTAELSLANEIIKTSEEKYRLVVDNVQETIFVAQDGFLKFVNPKAMELLEYSEAELHSKSFTEFIHEEDREMVYQNHVRRLRGETLADRYSFRILSKTGKINWVEISNVRIQWEDRPAVLAFLVDITARKKAEQALMESEDRYRTMVENLNDVIFSSNLDLKVEYVSPAVEHKTKYTQADIIGRSLVEFIHPDDVPELVERYPRTMKGEGEPTEYRIMDKDGGIIHVRAHSRPIYRDGRPVGMTGVITDITDKKLAEQALQESERNLRSIFDAISDLVFLMKMDGEILAANEALAVQLGKSTQDLIGTCIYDYDSPENAARHRAWIDEVALSGKPLQEEDYSGERKFHHVLYPVFNDHCVMDRVAVCIADITEKEKAERAVREGEERFRLAMDATSDGLWDWDISTGRRYFSPGYFRMVGYEPDELDCGSHPWTHLNHWNDGEKISSVYAACIEGKQEAFEIEFRMRHKNGEWLWILARGRSVFRDEHGRSTRMIGTHVDITSIKKAEEEIRESEHRFRALFEDVASVPVQGYDQSRKVVFWNSASERLYGYSREEALGKQLEDLIIPPHMREDVIKAVNNWMTKGERIPAAELTLIHKDGSKVPVYSSHVMLENTRGIKEMYCVDLDLAALKKGEEERALLKDQLREAQKMEAIGTLAGGIAHDFNNLMQVTLGYSDLMLEEKSIMDPDYGDLQKINQAALSGAELVRRLLTFCRKIEPMRTLMDVNSRIRHVERLLKRTIPKMIDVRLELTPDLDQINADPAQIEQIIINLALNARDAMGDEGLLVMKTAAFTVDEEYRISHPEAELGDYVEIVVSDTGHGMDDETIQHIFEPFFTTKEMGKGTGLGLAMVYGIVKQHGGHITCESELEKGTTFRVYFPSVSSVSETPREFPEEAPATGTETVLLIDDEDDVRELGERILRNAGYTVISAGSGLEGIRLFIKNKDKISLVILDLIMPKMGGNKCLKELVDIDPDVKVVIASGYSPEATIEQTFALGAKSFISKPFKRNELLRIIRKALDQN